MKKHIISRTLSFLLALTLIFAAAPLSAFGAGTGDESESESATATTYGSMADTLSDLYWLLFVKPFLKPSADAEGLPENAKLSFSTVSNPFGGKSNAANYKFLDFYDIKAVDKQTGKEIHPIGEVEVTITDARIKDNQSVFLLHILDDENVIRNSKNYVLNTDSAFISAFPDAAKAAEKATGKKGVAVEIIDDLAIDGNDITFKTSSFSIFIVQPNDLITVNIYESTADGAQPVETVLVKKSDTLDATEYEKLIYEPGIDATTAANALFRGWSSNPQYTVDDADNALTIQGVRDAVADAFDDTNHPSELNFYAMLYKRYTVTFYDELHVTCFGIDYALQRYDDAESGKKLNFRVNVPYTPYTEAASFLGWKLIVDDGQGNPINTYKDHLYGVFTQLGDNENPTEGMVPETRGDDADDYIYNNPVWIQITGDISLYAYAPGGNWLIFDENGKGATYYAPQFVEDNHSTADPRTSERPATRFGYTFDGWYYFPNGNAPAAQNGTVDLTDAVVFPFNKQFTRGEDNNIYYDNRIVTDHKITVYAKWKPNTTAGYSVIIWKQNIDADGYDFDRVINLTGSVGSIIDTVSRQGSGDSSYARINGTNYNGSDYKGFHLASFDTDVPVVTEGSSVVNVYYDRTQYTLTFQAQGAGYTYTETTSNNGEQYGFVNGEYVRITRDNNGFTEWYLAYNSAWIGTNWVEHTGTVYRRRGNTYEVATDYTYGDGKRYYRYAGGWTGYEELTWRSRTSYEWSYTDEFGTSHPYTGTRYTRSQAGYNTWGNIYTITALYGQDISQEFPIQGTNGVDYTGFVWTPQNSNIFTSGDVPYIEAMREENTVFHAREYGSSITVHMYYYTEALPGAAGDVEYNGKQYVEHQHVQIHANSGISSTRAEDFSEIGGFNQYTSVPAYNNNGTVDLNSSNNYTIQFYYTRKSYTLNFMDGTYVDGDGNVQDEINRNQLYEIDNVIYGSDISSYNNFKLDDYQGYVFEGWYLDRTCQTPCNFSSIPECGLTVYAKWRKIQYRVFLHPNAGTGDDRDESLDWGSASQSMNFRVDNGGTISIPTGRRTLYNFLGWYTDEELKHYFFADTRLSEDLTNDDGSVVLSAYNKSTDLTDIMDKWGEISGNPQNPNGWNSDAVGYNGGDRFWITKKLDLYAKWSYKLVGAKGIRVEYYSEDGYFVGSDESHFTLYCDNYLYADNTYTYAIAASYPSDTDMHFSSWQQMIWNATAEEWQPSSITRLPGEKFLVQLQESGIQIARRPSGSTGAFDEYVTSIPTVENDGYEYQYTIRLQANYLPAVPDKTQLVYDANGGDFTFTTAPDGFTVGTVTESGVTYNIIKNENLTVNSTFQVQPGTIVEREGYEFKGWSLTRNGDIFLYGTETENYGVDNLTIQSNPDNDGSNTLYAVWEIKTYNVVVKKEITNFQMTDDTWNQHGFMFYYSVTKDGDTLVADTLVKEGGVSVNGSANTGDTDTVIIANVPYGATLRIWEVLQEGGEQTLFLTDHDADNKIEIVLNDELALKDDGRTLAAPAVITNTGALGTIIVSKTVTDKNGTEFANEKFVFKLERLTSADGAVDATFAPVYFTLKDTGSVSFQVPSGYYQVTELDDWSWRYDAQGDTVKKCTIDQDNSTARAEFTNKRNDMNWLSGENSADNTFVVSNGR